MARTISARKRVRSSVKKNHRNRPARTQSKSYVIKAEKFIVAGDVDAAQQAVVKATSVLDKTARKGVIHANKAARQKSRLMKKFNQAKASVKA